jgi:hypothetical protein
MKDINPIWKSIKRKYRYTDIYKDKLWSAVSMFCVARDMKLHKGICIACGKKKVLQAGHYAPMSNCGLDLAFDEKNIHGECEYDNGFNGGHLIGYRMGLVARYGELYATELDNRYNDSRYKGKTTKISKLEYINRAINFMERLEELNKLYCKF